MDWALCGCGAAPLVDTRRKVPFHAPSQSTPVRNTSARSPACLALPSLTSKWPQNYSPHASAAHARWSTAIHHGVLLLHPFASHDTRAKAERAFHTSKLACHARAAPPARGFPRLPILARYTRNWNPDQSLPTHSATCGDTASTRPTDFNERRATSLRKHSLHSCHTAHARCAPCGGAPLLPLLTMGRPQREGPAYRPRLAST